MSLEENKALVRRYFQTIDEACEAGNADVIDDFLAPDFVEHDPFPGLPPTRDGWKQAFMAFVTGAPGYHVVEDLIAEDDNVVGRVTAYGTHTGELLGIPATGKEIRVSGIAIWRIRDGRIVEHWHETDQMGLMQQLAALSLRHLLLNRSAEARRDLRPPWRTRLGARRREQDLADRLVALEVGRLADDGRGPLEARERVTQRLGPKRALAVAKMLRLVPVRECDAQETNRRAASAAYRAVCAEPKGQIIGC